MVRSTEPDPPPIPPIPDGPDPAIVLPVKGTDVVTVTVIKPTLWQKAKALLMKRPAS